MLRTGDDVRGWLTSAVYYCTQVHKAVLCLRNHVVVVFFSRILITVGLLQWVFRAMDVVFLY